MVDKNTYPVDSFPFFFGDKYLLSSRRSRCIIIGLFAQKLQELFRVFLNQLGKLRVTGADLLKDRLQHLGLSLDDLAKLLELRVISKKIQVGNTSRSASSGPSASSETGEACSSATSTSATTCTASSSTSAAGLGLGCLEEIYRLVTCIATSIYWCCSVRGSCRLWRGSRFILPSAAYSAS